MTDVHLSENEIPSAKLVKEIEKFTKFEANGWLKCRGCHNLIQLNLKELKSK